MVDGDGSFYFHINKDKKGQYKNVGIQFSIVAANNPANKIMFEEIQVYFDGIGSIYDKKGGSTIEYVVSGIANCSKIREHFIDYPLMTFKLVYFKLWCNVLDLLVSKEHLTEEGLLKIIALKANSPNGLNENLILAFPNYKPNPLPLYEPDLENINVHWIAGFLNADGGFNIRVGANPKSALGKSTKIKIQITQNNISIAVLEKIKEYLGIGKVYPYPENNASSYTISSIGEANKFIELFKSAEFKGAKALDYKSFCEGIDLINDKKHLTQEGLEMLINISSKMNSLRLDFGKE